MQISTTPYVFSPIQIKNLEHVGIDLKRLHTDSQISIAYEKYLNYQRQQTTYGIALLVSNISMIIFAILDYRAMVVVSVAYIALFSHIYKKNKKAISVDINLVNKLGASYSELSKVSSRDGVALAVDAHARKKIHVAMEHVNNIRLQNDGTNYFEINQIVLNEMR